VGTPIVDILLVNISFNRIISTKEARSMTADIKDFCLATPLKRWKYIELRLSSIPEEVRILSSFLHFG
jgi:hypothetical protein